jgi:hypothetical protein
MDAYRNHRSDPHFTVDKTTIYQHINTSLSARSLRNSPNNTETNRDSVIQIEVVGFAHKPKDFTTLNNIARLCRWIESIHRIPRVWPNGLPKVATEDGKDPGGHNRDLTKWDTKGGHYGHCHVPENTHWDPGYLNDEVNFLMEAEFDVYGNLLEGIDLLERYKSIDKFTVDLLNEVSTMPGHSIVDSE